MKILDIKDRENVWDQKRLNTCMQNVDGDSSEENWGKISEAKVCVSHIFTDGHCSSNVNLSLESRPL